MARWKARVEFLFSVIELLCLSLTVEALQGKRVKTRCLQEGVGHLEPRFPGEGVVPLPIYWYHSKGNWLRYNTAAESFYTMKLCCRLLVLYCRNCPKDAKFRYVIAILRKLGAAWTLVDGSLESSCRVLVKSNWTSFSISYGWGATRQNVWKLAAFRWCRSLGAKISGGRVHPPANILIPLERQLIALQLCCWQFLYNQTL